MNGDNYTVLTGSNGDQAFIFNQYFPLIVDIGAYGNRHVHRTFDSWEEIEQTHKKTGVLLENRAKLGEM